MLSAKKKPRVFNGVCIFPSIFFSGEREREIFQVEYRGTHPSTGWTDPKYGVSALKTFFGFFSLIFFGFSTDSFI
jgi:hypothetical protein